MNKIIESVAPIEGMGAALKELSNSIQLGMLSLNSRTNLSTFLKQNNWEKYFAFIFSNSSLFGKHRSLMKLLKEKGLKKNEIIYVGDESRDIKAAKKAGVPIIAVSWGYELKKSLNSLSPDFFAEKPNDLIEIVKTLNK